MQLNQQAKNGFINNNLSEINFINNNKPAMASMKSVYEKQNKYFDYLINNEDDRKTLVKKYWRKMKKWRKNEILKILTT